MSKSDQDYVAKFAGNSIRYMPALAHALDSVNSALILCQLIYWHGMGHRYDQYIFKTASDMFNETGLSPDKQDTATKILVKRGLVHTKIAGIPAKKHYLVDLQKVAKLLTSWQETAPPEILKSLIQFPTKQQTTTETTQEITKKPLELNNYQRLPQHEGWL